jgi:thioredoxin 1
MIIEITDGDFEQTIQNSKIPILVDFWAEWCGPCRILTPIIEELSSELESKIKVVKMDIQNNPDVPSALGVRSIPTLMLFKDGKVIATKIGALAKEIILDWLEQELGAK